MHLQQCKARVFGKSKQAVVRRAESCPAPGVLKPGLALSSPLRREAAAAAAAARGAAKALAGTSYAHRIVSNTQSVKRLFIFHISSDSCPVFLDRECLLLKWEFL